MVLKRVYMQNAVFYSMVIFLAIWHHTQPNNASVLALWFLPLLFLIFLSIQLNHTRHDTVLAKILHYVTFFIKFGLIYLTSGLLNSYSVEITLTIYFSIIVVTSLIELFLLRGKNQVLKYKELFSYSMEQAFTDPKQVQEKTKYINETNFSILTLGFLIGGIHSLRVPELEFRSIFFNVIVIALVIYLYRKLQIANRKIYHRLLLLNLMERKALDKYYLFSQIILHISFLVTMVIKWIEGPNTITLLMFIPVLMNYPLIYLNRKLAKGMMTDEEKELMNID